MEIKPYGDTLNDGAVQISFSLPLPLSTRGKKAARELVIKMGIMDPRIVFSRDLGEGFSFYIVYGNLIHSVESEILGEDIEEEVTLDYWEINRLIEEKIGRKLVIVGATIGSDAHTVGIDAILNAKGFAGDVGLERYPSFTVHNLGSQVPPETLLEKVMDYKADVILVSQVVTQKNSHIHNLTQLVELVEGSALRDKVIMICGGPYISRELALEIGYDAGFGPHTLPAQVASFIVKRIMEDYQEGIKGCVRGERMKGRTRRVKWKNW